MPNIHHIFVILASNRLVTILRTISRKFIQRMHVVYSSLQKVRLVLLIVAQVGIQFVFFYYFLVSYAFRMCG